MSETWDRIKGPPAELMEAFRDPEFWLEFPRCFKDPAFWKRWLGDLAQTRIVIGTGFHLGSNGYWADANVGPSAGLLIGYDAKKDRYWNFYVNFGTGIHLGPKNAKYMGGGGGVVLSRDGFSWGGGVGAGRIGFGSDPVLGQSISRSVMNKYGVSIGDRNIGASRSLGLPTGIAKKLDGLLPAKMTGIWRWKVGVGGGIQGQVIEKGPSGVLFRWLIYPIEDYLQPRLQPVADQVKDYFDSSADEVREKLPGR